MVGAVLAQATENGPTWQVTAVVALLAALAGGLASTLGSRWATAADLRERNRHALLMDDLEKFQQTYDAVGSEDGVTPRSTLLQRRAAQIEVRTMLLSTSEMAAGMKILDARNSYGDAASAAEAESALFDAVAAVESAALARLVKAARRRQFVGWRPWRRTLVDLEASPGGRTEGTR